MPARTPERRHHSRRQRRWRAWWRADRGSVAAELTLIAPVLVVLLVLVGVLIHRGVDARLRIEDAAHQAARAASIERTPTTAATAATATARTALSSAGIACASLTVDATGGMQPGSTVGVTISCAVDLGDGLILGMPEKTLSATAVEPVDSWRSGTGGGS